MLAFTDIWNSIRVSRNITEECIGYIRKESVYSVYKYRFYPLPETHLDAYDLQLISKYMIEENKNGL